MLLSLPPRSFSPSLLLSSIRTLHPRLQMTIQMRTILVQEIALLKPWMSTWTWSQIYWNPTAPKLVWQDLLPICYTAWACGCLTTPTTIAASDGWACKLPPFSLNEQGVWLCSFSPTLHKSGFCTGFRVPAPPSPKTHECLWFALGFPKTGFPL